jgi:hypothetical protein
VKITRKQLRKLIIESFYEKGHYDVDKEDFDAAAAEVIKDKPGIAFTYPREVDDLDSPVYDEYDEIVWATDEWGNETGPPVYEKKPIGQEIARTGLRRAGFSGASDQHLGKLADLYRGGESMDFDDDTFVQADALANQLSDYEGPQVNPELSKGIDRARNLQAAYDEIRDSSEMSYYLSQLSNRMMHDGSSSYQDDFHNADIKMTDFEEEIAKKYGLTEDEIDRLDDALASAKDAY